MKRILFALCILVVVSTTTISIAHAGDEPVVRGVLFWLDTCPHCHYVGDEVLPPLQEQYGDQLDIQLIMLDSEDKAAVFHAAGAAAGLLPEEMGVPLLVVGDTVMMGSAEIPEQLPGLIERYLAEGGVDLPDLPGLDALVQVGDPALVHESGAVDKAPAVVESVDTPGSVAAPIDEPVIDLAAPTGISGSIPAFVVLAGMVTALAFVAVMPFLARGGSVRPPEGRWVSAAIPVLAAAGILVAAYLAYVEAQAVAPICGPVGDCAAVQTSEYSRLFGVPVGYIGIAGYVAILAAWFAGRNGNAVARGLLLGMAVIGVLYSIYLTWLELFVIRAVCMWCVSSAVIMTLIMLAAAAWLASTWTSSPTDTAGRPARV